jgi:hypothetical protein
LRSYREQGSSIAVTDAPAPNQHQTIQRLAMEGPSLLVEKDNQDKQEAGTGAR